MKQLTLFLLLTLFVISCGDDNDPISPNNNTPESLFPMADGNKWYMDLLQNSGGEDEEDRISQYYITFKYKGESNYESNPVKLYTLYFVNAVDTTESFERDHFFEYQDYIYSTYDDAIAEGSITKASKIFIKNIEKEGVIYIDDDKYNVQKDSYTLDGKEYFAWELRRISDDPGYTFIEKYIPGIGIAYRYIEDKTYGSVREESLYKYELH